MGVELLIQRLMHKVTQEISTFWHFLIASMIWVTH